MVINQRMTREEGAIPGKLRITQTGQQFDKMTVVLLDEPRERRNYHIGEAGKLNRTPENLMCFSYDMKHPHEKSKQPQCRNCSNCPRASWDKYRNEKIKANIPPCDAFWYLAMIGTEARIPLNMYVRSTSKAPLEKGMAVLSNHFSLLISEAKRAHQPFPNIYEVSFVIGTKQDPKNDANYLLNIDTKSFHVITEEEKADFGPLYLDFVNKGKTEEDLVEEEATKAAGVAATIDAEFEEVKNEEGEIAI